MAEHGSRRLLATFAAFAAVVGAASVSACGEDFEPSDDPTDAGTDGSGGVGGGTDSGGDSADSAATCDDDTDCDDGDPCNGTETCDDSAGTCVPGAAPCSVASDPAHCVIPCTVVAGAAQCGAEEAVDADGDGHGDPNCASAPGDDCDDANDQVYPGATETCDGIDADCDGVVDIDEGLPLGGQPFTIASPLGEDASRPRAAWVASAQRLGVVWAYAGVEARLDILDATGAAVGSTVELVPPQFDQHGVTIASDGTSFGIAWVGEITGDIRIFFQLFDPNGVAKGAEVNLGGPVEFDAEPAIFADASGFVVVWRQRHSSGNFDEVYGRRLDSSGAPTTSAISLTSMPAIASPSVASTGSGFALANIGGGAGLLNNAVRLTLVNGSLGYVGGAPLTTTVSPPQLHLHPELLAVTSGLFAVWASSKIPAGTLHVMELAPDGSQLCGPVSTTTHGDDTNVGRAIALGKTRLVALYENHTTAAASVTLARFDDQCNEASSIDVVGATVQPAAAGSGDRVDIAAGDRIAVVWDETIGANARVRGRIFGKNLCD